MNKHSPVWMLVAIVSAWGMSQTLCHAQAAAELPEGVRAVWDLSQADRETTPRASACASTACGSGSRRIRKAIGCRRATGGTSRSPDPGRESPTICRRISRRCMRIRVGRTSGWANVTAAWYQREITIPAAWTGRRIAVYAEYLNSYAAVYLDGKRAGEIRFPAGEVEITSACRPGATHVLSMLVVAMPLKGVRLSYNDSNAAREVKGSVARRGLCGDVYLVATPAGARIAGSKVDTSVRKGSSPSRPHCRTSRRTHRTRSARS